MKDNFSETDLKLCLSNFATGVTIITAVDEHYKMYGITVNSFNSVSIDPPLVLFSIEKKAFRFGIFTTCKYFIVNILSEGQEYLSQIFAERYLQDWTKLQYFQVRAIPVLHDILAYIHCSTEHIYDGGDHKIIVGRVLGVKELNVKARPLLYYKGDYYKIKDL